MIRKLVCFKVNTNIKLICGKHHYRPEKEVQWWTSTVVVVHSTSYFNWMKILLICFTRNIKLTLP